ncbi:hypothetical protein IWQ60_009753 [Tieghemiomyces parasiticus]|uniref:Peroxin-7 n=1 Tax=Tieghemiomyces parasiticus TaxID=78921 RepID=A0A9W7ZLY9_9FUNG|nr:hypothetical protein IWQ60_009753 [Tieghemiomyces parasiticus]
MSISLDPVASGAGSLYARSGLADISQYTSGPYSHLNDWRSSFLAGDNASQSELKTARLVLPDKAQFTTCIAASQTSALLAVGSGGPSPNLFVVKGQAATLESDDGTVPSMELKAQASSRYPTHSVAFSDRHIVTGNDRGVNLLYTVDTEALLSHQADAYPEAGSGLKLVATYRNKLSRAPEVPVPGKYLSSRRVLRTDFEPVTGRTSGPDAATRSSHRFLAAVGPVVHIWDVNDSSKPVRDDRVAPAQITAAHWHPYPFSQLLAVGCVDRALSVADIRKRGKPVVWKVRGAHRGPINDVQWSPFIPYWLASAGDDNNAHIWDLRYLSGPVFSIQQHQRSITSLCWSNTHCDMLSTGSADRHWRLWTLRPGSHAGTYQRRPSKETPAAPTAVSANLIADSAQSITGFLAGISCPATFDNTYFACSSKGELTSFQLTEGALEAVAIHRFTAGAYPTEYEIEQLAYQRNFADAVPSFSALARGADKDPQLAAHIEALSRLLVPKDAITWDGWTIPPLPPAPSSTLTGRHRLPLKSDVDQGIRAFRKDLTTFSYGLPPNARPRHHPAKLSQVQMVLTRLSANSEVQEFEALVLAGDWQTLVADRSRVEQAFTASPQAYPVNLLRGMLKLILPHDCLAALELGMRVVAVYGKTADQAVLIDLTGVVHLLLYPTVYDTEAPRTAIDPPSQDARHRKASFSLIGGTGGFHSAREEAAVRELPSVRQQLYRLLRDRLRAVLGMIQLEVQVQKTVLRGGEQAQVADAIVQLMLPCPYTVSAGAMRLYLNSLVQTRRYDEYLVHVTHLIPEFQGYELAQILQHQATSVVAPRLKKQLNLILTSAEHDPLNLEITMYRDTLNKLAKLLTRSGGGANGIPGFPGPMLVEYFTELSRAFFKVLGLMLRQQEEVEEVTRDTRPLLNIWTDLLYRPQWKADQQWDKLTVGSTDTITPEGTADRDTPEAIRSSVFFYPPVEGHQVQPVLDALEKIRNHFYVQ